MKSDMNHSVDNIKVYFKNGHYHQMQWSITKLEIELDHSKEYLCVGQFAVDEKNINEKDEALLSQFDFTYIEDRLVKEKFIELTPNLVWIVDGNAKLFFVSDTFLQFFNLKPLK